MLFENEGTFSLMILSFDTIDSPVPNIMNKYALFISANIAFRIHLVIFKYEQKYSNTMYYNNQIGNLNLSNQNVQRF